MLTITTLNDLNNLSAEVLYELEVKQLDARLSPEAQAMYIEQARAGDNEARQALILHCISYALVKANGIYYERRPRHIDALDLAQEANLKMLEGIDKALEVRQPVSYLVTLAVRAIQEYCTYHAPMIQKPEYSRERLARVDPYPATVESLDEPIYEEGRLLKVELIEAPAPHAEPNDKKQQYRFKPLYKAVKKHLTSYQRAIVTRRYGLFGQSAESPSEIAESWQTRQTVISGTDYKARKKLAQVLEGDLSQMLRPKPVLDEED
jgi:RNA polymerase sigma factor (sigma-70 family)